MSNINILDSSVFNKIAAGEVVERPSSVVKELLDNSIDAKASRIVVKITEGGIKKIEVIDNGCGILKEDFNKVFLAHATSKIKTAEDLEKIGTLGFRGEALASIASVSKVMLTSKVENELYGSKLNVAGGQKSEIFEVGCANGTTIEVSDLFFNVPARAKFLKKPRQEQTEITNLICRYILANPFVSISYFADDVEVLMSNGNGLKDALYVVYGKEILDNLIEVDYTSKNNIKVSGWASKPTFSKPNKTYQTLIVNGRYVINSMVSLCIFNAYERYLMKGQFPFYVINLNIPLEKLDVNVHPNKMDIRFENSNEIYGVAFNAISNAISLVSTSIGVAKLGVFGRVESGVSYAENNTIQSVQFENANLKNREQQFNLNTFFQNVGENTLKENTSEFKANLIEEQMKNNTPVQTVFVLPQVKFIGTIYSTYLLIQTTDTCYLIDQHAAHERLLFDSLKQSVDEKNVESQILLLPYILNVNHLENEFLINNLDNLKKIGLSIENFGNLSYKITSVPAVLKNLNLDWFFSLLLGDLSIFKNLKQSDLILEKLMQHACKSAIKAGDNLTELEVLKLLEKMKTNNMELQCPHGRPVMVELSKNEIEKWFKRTK